MMKVNALLKYSAIPFIGILPYTAFPPCTWAATRQTTLEVYYPSTVNAGVGTTRTEKMGIGTDYRNTPETSLPANGLIVQGNVGIGTAKPGVLGDSNDPTLTLFSNGNTGKVGTVEFDLWTSLNNQQIGKLSFVTDDGPSPNAGGTYREVARIDSIAAPGATSLAYADLRFMTAGSPTSLTERMRITNAGNVGIGGNIYTPTDTGQKFIFGGTGMNGPWLELYGRSHASWPGNAYLNFDGITATGQEFAIIARTATGADPGYLLTVKDTGNVGIGTPSPQKKLHVGTGVDAPAVDAGIYTTNAGNSAFAVRDSTNDIEGFLFTGTSGSDTGVVMGAVTNHPLFLRTNNATRLTISTAGNVGIGTTDPRVSLQVSGLVHPWLAVVKPDNGVGTPHISINNQRPGGREYSLAVTSNDNGEANAGMLFLADRTASGIPNRLVINSTGNVGIGTTTPNPAARLHVVSPGLNPGSSWEIALAGVAGAMGETTNTGTGNSTGLYGVSKSKTWGHGVFGYCSATDGYTIGVRGLVDSLDGYSGYFQGGQGVFSDKGFIPGSSLRWKTNIQPIEGALEKLLKLRGVTFDWKDTGRHSLGLVAEEVGRIFPELVVYEANGKDAIGLDYDRLEGILIEAMKEQQKQIEALKAEVAALKKL